jgi:hypothetical protein
MPYARTDDGVRLYYEETGRVVLSSSSMAAAGSVVDPEGEAELRQPMPVTERRRGSQLFVGTGGERDQPTS